MADPYILGENYEKNLSAILTLTLIMVSLTSYSRENNLIQSIEKEDRSVRFLVHISYGFMLDLPVSWTNTCTIDLFTKSIKDVDDEYQGCLGTFMKISD